MTQKQADQHLRRPQNNKHHGVVKRLQDKHGTLGDAQTANGIAADRTVTASGQTEYNTDEQKGGREGPRYGGEIKELLQPRDLLRFLCKLLYMGFV